MNLARYWTRQPGEAIGPDGKRIRVAARGWSNDSLEAARELARETAARLAARLASGCRDRLAYLYGDRPLPEPVLREFRDRDGGLVAVTTRNAYGAVVLNTRDMMFVDIDRPDAHAAHAGGLLSRLRSLFVNPPPPPPPDDAVVAAIRSVAGRHDLNGTIYQTAAGYRVVFVNRRFDAAGAATASLLEEFGCDPLYIRLCRGQRSFRARLTPKPWRCGARLPPARFPFETPREESRFRAWEARYDAKAAPYATCRLVREFGGAGLAGRDIRELEHYHNQITRATSGLPLA